MNPINFSLKCIFKIIKFIFTICSLITGIISFIYNCIKKIGSYIFYIFLRLIPCKNLLKLSPPYLSAKVLNNYDINSISTKLLGLNKKSAWNILRELGAINEDKFLNLLKSLDITLLNDFLLLEPISPRMSILHKINMENKVLIKNQKKIQEGNKDVKIPIIDKRNIEELRDMLPCFKHDAEFLYQYGEPTYSFTLFNKLSINDQNRLISLGLALGDKDIHNVINYLKPEHKKLEERGEIEEIITQCKHNISIELSQNDVDIIIKELQKAYNDMSSLEVENAFWILIPYTDSDKAIWVEAVGNENNEFLSKIRFDFQVVYSPGKKKRYELITAMRKHLWILHIHNHPRTPDSLLGPSKADLGFAQQWKSFRPELSNKMKFFIIEQKNVIEYALPNVKIKEWLNWAT